MSLNVELLTSSFEEIKVHADDFTAYFYQTLFTDYPFDMHQGVFFS